MELLYSRGEAAEHCYLLTDGTVYIRCTPEDKIPITGKNIIVGASELLLEHTTETPYNRLYSVYAEDMKSLRPVPKENFLKLIKSYQVGYQLAVHACNVFSETEAIFNKYKSLEGEAQKAYEERARLYFDLVSDFKELANKFHFTDLLQLSNQFGHEVLYEIGKMYSTSEDLNFPVKAGAIGTASVPAQTTLCSEGEPGDALFILQGGSINVLVGGERVAVLERPGTVMGELALFLGKPRAATLVTARASTVITLDKKSIAQFHNNHPEFFIRVIESTCVRTYHLFSKIKIIYDNHIKSKKENSILLPDFVRKTPGEDKIVEFCKMIDMLQRKKQMHCLKEFMGRHKNTFDVYLAMEEKT